MAFTYFPCGVSIWVASSSLPFLRSSSPTWLSDSDVGSSSSLSAPSWKHDLDLVTSLFWVSFLFGNHGLQGTVKDWLSTSR